MKTTSFLITLILFLFYFSFNYCYSQEIIFIKGNVTDSITNLPIPYVNILDKGTSKGVISNENGAFQLEFPLTTSTDSLYFSCVGYKPIALPINSFNNNENKNVRLSTATYSINTVVVKPGENALEIVKRAIKNIAQNYCAEPYIMDGFYREYIKENNNYAKLAEAAVSVYDIGYGKEKPSKYSSLATEKFKINSFKKSDDYTSCSVELAMINRLDRIFSGNAIRYYRSIFNPNSLNDFVFRMDSITYFENELYFVISYISDNENISESGTTLINVNDYSILSYTKNWNRKKSTWLPNGRRWKGLPGTQVIKFRKKENKLFLSYFRSSFGDDVVDENSNSICKTEYYTEFMVTDMKLKEVMPFNDKELMDKKKDLFVQFSSFNTSVFEKGNILVPTELQKQIEKDINKRNGK